MWTIFPPHSSFLLIVKKINIWRTLNIWALASFKYCCAGFYQQRKIIVTSFDPPTISLFLSFSFFFLFLFLTKSCRDKRIVCTEFQANLICLFCIELTTSSMRITRRTTPLNYQWYPSTKHIVYMCLHLLFWNAFIIIFFNLCFWRVIYLKGSIDLIHYIQSSPNSISNDKFPYPNLSWVASVTDLSWVQGLIPHEHHVLIKHSKVQTHFFFCYYSFLQLLHNKHDINDLQHYILHIWSFLFSFWLFFFGQRWKLLLLRTGCSVKISIQRLLMTKEKSFKLNKNILIYIYIYIHMHK